MTKETSNAIEVLGQLIWSALQDKPGEEKTPIYNELNRVIAALNTAESERALWEEGCRRNEECYKAAVRKQDEQRLKILELTKERDEARESHDKEIGEFQDEARALILKMTGAPENTIDGKGSDAGWQEFTLAEIGQGIAYLKDKLEAAQALVASYDRQDETIGPELAESIDSVTDIIRILKLERDEARAACAEMRGLLDNINKSIHGLVSDSYYPHILHALSSDCGKELLAERERYRKALEMVRDFPNAQATYLIVREALNAKGETK